MRDEFDVASLSLAHQEKREHDKSLDKTYMANHAQALAKLQKPSLPNLADAKAFLGELAQDSQVFKRLLSLHSHKISHKTMGKCGKHCIGDGDKHRMAPTTSKLSLLESYPRCAISIDINVGTLGVQRFTFAISSVKFSLEHCSDQL